jgi:DNA-binding NarL/FixJ family response regulator
MSKPLSRILVIEDEPLVLREIVKGLNAAARTLDNPLGISFSGVATAREALAAIEADGDIQAVLVDDKLYSLRDAKKGDGRKMAGAARGSGAKQLQMSALELVQRVTRMRPELDVYILIAQETEDDVVDALFTEAVDGYFYREERDYRGIYRILNAQIQEKARTPFTDALKNYVWMAKDQWHTPGHSSGESLRGSRSVGLRADARFADGAQRRDRRGAGNGGQGLRRAAHLLRHQWHLHCQQGHLPDPARPGREAAARPQLPQERAPRRGAFGRAPGLPRLGAQQEIRPLRSRPPEDPPE